jgi:hypothetical protein
VTRPALGTPTTGAPVPRAGAEPLNAARQAFCQP